ncbi:MAG: ABC transporter ATP-binding protein [Clostridia bacterium]|nr:ABC transporter ATP-binding protein [Clostridia bacterium]
MDADALVQVRNLKKHFPIRRGAWKRVAGCVRAVDDVSFDIREGETLGLVGESGCGKTTAGRCILRAIGPTSGKILFRRRRDEEPVDLAALNKSELRAVRRDMQLVFQDPYSSLNPRMTVKDIIGEPLLVNRAARGAELDARVADLMERVGLRPEYMARYPHAFSGGQRQRIGIARALALNPKLIVCDESVSALDVSIQAQILNLLQDLQDERRLTYLFIAHDLSVIEHISDRVAVMYVGKIVELAESSELFTCPKHPYTEALLSAAPKPDPRLKTARILLQGEVADPADPPSGCYFHPRCAYASEICSKEAPELRMVGARASGAGIGGGSERLVACHLAETLELAGMGASRE